MIPMVFAPRVAFLILAAISLLPLATLPFSNPIERLSNKLGIVDEQYDARLDVLNSTLGFEKIFVINMPERTDKRDAMALSASLCNVSVEFAEGIKGDTIPDKALPLYQEDRHMHDAFLGSWRAHLNVLRQVVEKGLSTVLILEDDADWDIRIKQQMAQFVSGSRWLQGVAFDAPTLSPYGDDWDVLWLGHWVDGFGELDVPMYVIENDATTPHYHHISGDKTPEWIKQYPAHSRVMHQTVDMVGSIAYAVSYRGARRILFSLSVSRLFHHFDVALSEYCKDAPFGDVCITSNPALFRQHRMAGQPGKNSDNVDWMPQLERAQTFAIQWPVKMNWEKLLDGRTDFVDQYDDPPEAVTEKNDRRA